jgi:CHAT domain-containing protein
MGTSISARFKKVIRYVGLGMLTFIVAIAFSSTFTAAIVPIANSPTVQTAGDAQTLLQQGRNLAAAGRFSEAAAVWQQAARLFGQQNDALKAAMSFNYLAFAYLQLGQLQQALAALQEAKTSLQRASNEPGAGLVLAQTLNTQGSIQLALGQTEAALETWQKAETAYADAKDEVGKLGAMINQAQALQTLGLYRRSQTLLEQVSQQLQSQPDSLIKATGLRSLGVALQVVGDLTRSRQILQQSLEISQRLRADASNSTALFSLGNTARAQEDFKAAVEFYQQAAAKATNPLDKTEALLSQLAIHLQQNQQQQAVALLPQIREAIATLPPSRMSVYAQVNFAQSLIKLMQLASPSTTSPEIAKLLANAIKVSQQLNDRRAEAYAVGELGKLYQLTGQLAEAQNLTEQALLIANEIKAEEIAYRWQAQLGSILKIRGDRKGAIAAYSDAVKTLNTIRRDLVAINPEVQFSFRESVEPVYRELVALLLEPTPENSVADEERLKTLIQAREVLEALQLAEIDNFFREACLEVQAQQIDKIDPKAAVIYPIILKDRIEVILSLPRKPLRHYETKLSQAEIDTRLRQVRGALSLSAAKSEHLTLFASLYDWLIRPAETEIAEAGVKTLVFVSDGYLRNLPMAALYDGKEYLIQKYSVAVTPSLQLLDPRPLPARQIRTLIGGLSEARQGFVALPGVQSEVNLVSEKVSSEVLLNQKFTEKSLKKALAETNRPIVHLATHGQFSSKLEDTFILTWDGKMNVAELGSLLRTRDQTNSNPIELLVLSACQTARGDNRAALGLAGLSVRSGARATLATLWAVRDQSTADLMVEFYKQLAKPGITKSEALRQAQLFLLQQPQYDHPFYWASFILVGNWL